MFDLEAIENQPRLLFEVKLSPAQGKRFQPTGFPDLGAATYTLPDGKTMLLVESAQSMANRLESTTWDEIANDLVAPLQGLPYVAAFSPTGKFITSSILEAHRLNSPYLLDSKGGEFLGRLKSELEGNKAEDPVAVDLRHAARVVFKYDPNSVLHGLFLASPKLAGGRYRLTRLLSAFMEAEDVHPVESGGVKNDRVDPSGKALDPRSGREWGYGNVPFHRTEFTADPIRAYFSLDLATLRGYGLGENAERLIITLALWKIRSLLSRSLRLRTACHLVAERSDCLMATVPPDFALPTAPELSAAMPGLIAACRSDFADPPVTKVTWSTDEAKRLAPERMKKEKGREKKDGNGDEDSNEDEVQQR
ncbi:MAG: type I-U CRISPR-associated RAMP protein Csb1/Cas7u [Bacillota bacterium]